jgi:prepilin-type N-terminal cleavage/methylation domain-containing protein
MMRGYSLLELIVVLAIAAALVVVATPAVQASVDRMTLAADTRALMTSLRRLREDALDRQADITLTVSGAAANEVVASTGETLQLTSGTSVRVATVQGVVIAWDGTIRGTLRLSRGAREAIVTTDPLTGRPITRGAP